MIIPGEPKGKGRPRFYNGHAVTPQDTRDYEREVAELYKADGGKMFEGPVEVHIRAYYKIPKRTSRKAKAEMIYNVTLPTRKPDVDNIGKIILDGLNGVAYEDDKQVIALTVYKLYAEEPYVQVEVMKP